MSPARPLLVATDLDGTLVPHDTLAPPPYTASVLRRLDAAGVPVVFTTARPLRWMDGFWPHVGRHGLAVVSNGAITVDIHAGRIIDLTGIDAPTGVAICSAIEDELPGAQFAIECADGIRLDPGYLGPHAPPEAPRGPLADIWTDPAVKLLVRHPGVPDEQLQARTAAVVGRRATVTWSVPGLVEISAAGVTKASALRRLCRRLGIDAGDVVAFGDMPNDLPLLAWAGTAYAVANAHPTVLEAADHVAPACADEGVAQVLDRIAPPARAVAERALPAGAPPGSTPSTGAAPGGTPSAGAAPGSQPPTGAAPGSQRPVVRRAVARDVPAICAFGEAVVPAHYEPVIGRTAAAAQVRDWWNESAIRTAVAAGSILVAVVGDAIAGVGQLGRSGDDYAIYKLYLAPGHRGHGLGARLLDALAAEVPAGAGRVLVEHFAANTRAGAFYAREGFAVDRVEPSASGDHALDVVWRARTIAGPDRLPGSGPADQPGRTPEPS